MEKLDDLQNETFNDLLNDYFKNTETYNHYEFAVELARESTGFGTVFDLLETADLCEYTGFDPEDLDTDVVSDFEYDGFLLQETADKFIADLNDGLSSLNLQAIPYFDELYNDFLYVTGYEGEKEEFEYSLKRSTDFFNFVVDVTTED